MTRVEAKEVLIIKAGYGDFVENIIDQIYDDHEAQIKAKDEEIERLKEHITHLQNVYMKLDGKYLKLKTELEELKDNK